MHYKKFYFFATVKGIDILTSIVKSGEVSNEDAVIISKLIATDDVRSFMEYMRATQTISCAKHVSVINKHIRQNIIDNYLKNVVDNSSIETDIQELCNEFTYDGSYFLNPITHAYSKRTIRVDIAFHDKNSYNTFKLKNSNTYTKCVEVVD